ncbi:MAG: hypothetical protein A3G33_02660 [Omnitrophica bacterium RIFCSPLOWO2_12_FULL_44_17]|uniref:AMP nucleosidase n=1 Tax=Candidatus Danuiimicrobium aquiferis TaxID=1801832 RepID=A0A1G1KRT4_9BACT|nr:MAG: hypothetical protein A3E74_08025 [Omnitrophica bacterium RIFCSPHIGHO2_12_FULL_44_12]OGW95522.1 MAG: hypothetical protein A3G33_02660 [Omnitrophica bacterium RIFCSPLOWO2_12_FULL_44_17]OGX01614.1 MAG: hypothetical protein A3J12_05755 [Omnitrophica bacterium RIFCSPLOWO2_02_FULL_44_11]
MKEKSPSDIKLAGILKDPKLVKKVQALVRAGKVNENVDLAEQMIATVLKLNEEDVDRGDLKILNTTLKELRFAFRVFRPYRHIQKVTIFGSARILPDDSVFKLAKKFAQVMAETGWMVITGASTGIMHAGNEGAGRALSFGANIRLPMEQSVNPVIEGDKKLINFKYFFARKLIFVKESDAICLFPGGFGTLDESFEALTLIQTGKTPLKPIVLLDDSKTKYWSSWLRFVRESLLKFGLISPEDFHLFQIAKSAEEARDIILQFYRSYHSMRFVGDQLVIRLRHPLTKKNIAKLNKEFKDILKKGKIEPSGPLAVEANDSETGALPRLVLYFDRRNYGRLKHMVDQINLMGD